MANAWLALAEQVSKKKETTSASERPPRQMTPAPPDKPDGS